MDEPAMPAGFDYLWTWFLRLDHTRSSGFGMSGITETELRAFFKNRSIVPEDWELEVILKLDNLRMQSASESAPKEE